MPVAYQELEDSPRIVMDRKGGKATRRALIAWDDVIPFFEELFPSPFNGYGNATYPGLPHLIVDAMTVQPFVPNPDGNCEPINTFHNMGAEGCEVTVEYRPPSMDGGMQGGNLGDWSGPGGSEGSTGNQSGEDQTFVTHDLDIGGEFLTYPSQNFRWQYPRDNKNPALAAIDEFNVTGDTVTGVLVPHIEHTISWHQVQWPPWNAIRQCMGKVNAYRFSGCPRGVLLFLGAKARKEWTNRGAKAWTMDYKIMEKNHNTSNPKAPKGWNYFLRPDGWRAGQYELLYKRVPVVDLGGGRKGVPTTTLAAGIGVPTKLITVADDSEFPTEGQFRIVVFVQEKQWEIMEVTVHNLLNWTVLRGAAGTKIRDWPAGATIQQVNGLVYDSADFRYLFQPGIALRA